MAVLRFINDQGELQTKGLGTEQFTVGRASTCQITFDNDMISREHFRIDVEADGRFHIKDLGSRNKTYVNGELISDTILTGGDIVRAGDCVLEFLDDETSPERVDLEFLTPDRKDPPHCEWVKLKAPISLKASQLEQLGLLFGDLPLTARAEDVAHACLGQVLLDCQAERGFIALRGEQKGELRPLAHRALKRPPAGSLTPVSQSFALAPILQSVAGRYPQTASQLDTKLGYAVTALVAPLTFRGDVVGVIYVDRPASKKPFPATAMSYCIAAGAQIGTMIGNVTRQLLFGAAREGVAWLATLRRVQASLTMPVASTDAFGVAVRRFPGRVRCGDFGDVIQLDEQHCVGIVLDGGGHGMSGMVQANAVRMAIRTSLAISDDVISDPAPLFNELSSAISTSATRQVIACTFVGIDLAAGKLTYINAGGMPPLLLLAPGRLVTLDQPSLLLGVDPTYTYEPTRVDLPDTFRLVCHTDGMIDATSVAGEPIGHQRLHEALLDREAFAHADELVVKVEQAWKAHLAGSSHDDDATLLVITHG